MIKQKNNLKSIFWIGSVAILYFIMGITSLSFVVKPVNIPVIWPLSGLFLSAVLITQKKLRPWLVGVLFIVDFIVEMLAGSSPVVSLFYSFSLAFHASFSAWLLITFAGTPLSFNKSKHVFLFILLSVVLSNALASSISAFAPTLFLGESYWESWKWWWSADAVGNLLVTPFILSWYYLKKLKLADFRLNKILEGTALFVSLIIVINLEFKNILSTFQLSIILNYLTFPFLIWAALRFGVRGVTSTSLILSALVLGFILGNPHIFPDNKTLLNAIIQVQLFIAIITIASLFLAATVSENKQVSKALVESKVKYQDLYENAPDMFVSVHSETTEIIRCNETLLKNTGYNRDEIIGHPIVEMYHPDCMDEVKKTFQSFVDTGEVDNAELQLKRKDGSKIDVILNRSSVHDEKGKILYSNSSFHDITELKKVRIKLLNTNRVLAFISQINQMIVHVTEKAEIYNEVCRIAVESGKFRMAWIGMVDELKNDIKPVAWEGMEDGYLATIPKLSVKDVPEGRGPTGIAIREGAASFINDIATDPVTAPWREEALKRGYSSSCSLPLFINKKVVGVFNIYASEPFFFNEEEIKLLEEVVNNISFALYTIDSEHQRKMAEKALQASEMRFSELLENINLIAVLLDLEGKVTYCNPHLIKLSGYTKEEILGSDWFTGMIPDSNPETKKEFLKGLKSGKIVEHFENPILTKNGELRDILWNNSILRNSSGSVIGTASIGEDITKGKRAEAVLKESEERFRKIFEEGPIGIAMADFTDSHFINVNRAFCEMLGYSEDELKQLTFADVIHPEHRNQDAIVVKSMEEGQIQKHVTEKRYLKKSGETIWATRALTKTYRTDGTSYALAMIQDITEQKLYENKIREKDIQFRKLSSNVPDLIFQFTRRPDGSYYVPIASSGIINIFGCSPEDVLKDFTPIGRVIYPEDAARVISDIEYSAKHLTYFTCEFRVQIPGKEIQWIYSKSSPEKLADGSITWYGFNTDITERKKAEEEIKKTNEELLTLNRVISASSGIKNIKDILDDVLNEAINIVGLEGGTICLVEPEGTLKLISHKETSEATILDLTENRIKTGDCLCGNCALNNCPLILYNREEVLKYATREALRGEDIRLHAAFPITSKEKCVGVLCVFTRTDKKPEPRSLKLLETMTAHVALAIENAKLFDTIQQYTTELEERVSERTIELEKKTDELTNNQTALINIVEDLNEKTLELDRNTKLLETKNKELETFTYSVSHDLKAPLRGIDGYSRLLEEEYADVLKGDGQKFVKTIREGTKQMNQLIEDLLAYSRLERSIIRTSRLNIQQIIDSILIFLKRDIENNKISVEVNVDNCEVMADSDGLTIAVRNLIENAIKFSRQVENPKIIIVLKENVYSWVLSVEDNGIGFDMKYHDRIFEIFQRLNLPEKYSGTGIGLAMVHKTMERMGGKVWAESSSGNGAKFYLEIPKK